MSASVTGSPDVSKRGHCNAQDVDRALKGPLKPPHVTCFVKVLQGKIIRMQMPRVADVGALKGAISMRTSITPSEQKLMAGGKQLRNSSRLEELCDGEELDVALNLGLAGGGDDE